MSVSARGSVQPAKLVAFISAGKSFRLGDGLFRLDAASFFSTERVLFFKVNLLETDKFGCFKSVFRRNFLTSFCVPCFHYKINICALGAGFVAYF